MKKIAAYFLGATYRKEVGFRGGALKMAKQFVSRSSGERASHCKCNLLPDDIRPAIEIFWPEFICGHFSRSKTK